MKKSLTIVTLASAMLLAGCSSNNSNSSNNNSGATSQETSSSSSQVDLNKVGFSNGTAVLDDLSIQITDHKVIQKGEQGNEYGDKPVLAIWYKTTNKTDKEISATMAWQAVFSAYQDNDPNKENKLNVGMLPDSNFRDSQLANIKKRRNCRKCCFL
ncbi:DUF5067 domain-containing protein [Holzapfeliella floricola]|uniref:DUF5067 domain-containing protein n=1 Tax=Holzapfeliella floricola TaxID=679249 RepID=UPI000A6C1B99|nr:DUF5067 domain-containing protein [Holzapfeliella floricola]